eukprot:g1964.t1
MKRATWQPSSRLIGERLEAQMQRVHVDKLLSITASIDNSRPKTMRRKHSQNKKRLQAKRERQRRIQEENNRMIHNILELDPKKRL